MRTLPRGDTLLGPSDFGFLLLFPFPDSCSYAEVSYYYDRRCQVRRFMKERKKGKKNQVTDTFAISVESLWNPKISKNDETEYRASLEGFVAGLNAAVAADDPTISPYIDLSSARY